VGGGGGCLNRPQEGCKLSVLLLHSTLSGGTSASPLPSATCFSLHPCHLHHLCQTNTMDGVHPRSLAPTAAPPPLAPPGGPSRLALEALAEAILDLVLKHHSSSRYQTVGGWEGGVVGGWESGLCLLLSGIRLCVVVVVVMGAAVGGAVPYVGEGPAARAVPCPSKVFGPPHGWQGSAALGPRQAGSPLSCPQRPPHALKIHSLL
jgi:hypothetical protein